ncbi:glycerophosphodiester phosphodiesterase family protein, partial [Streptomyces cellulosae]
QPALQFGADQTAGAAEADEQHQRLARATVLREAARGGLFTMVWTVNDDAAMRAFLADRRVDVLVTDRPRRAVTLRDHPDGARVR